MFGKLTGYNPHDHLMPQDAQSHCEEVRLQTDTANMRDMRGEPKPRLILIIQY